VHWCRRRLERDRPNHAADFDPDTLQRAQRHPSMLVEGAEPILIDEWQRLPAAWDVVRRSVDEGFRPGRFSSLPGVRSVLG